MANMILDWALFGTYGTELGGSTTVNTGGMDVTVDYLEQDECSWAQTRETEQYVAPGESFDPNSALKLFGAGGEGGVDNTSTTTFSFAATDDDFTDQVQNVSFRINDIDARDSGMNGQDIVTVRAYDASGAMIPVVMSTTGSVVLAGNTATGVSDGGSELYANSPDASVLVNIAGPVARIEIDYDNGGDGNQYIWVTDINFATVDACGPGSDGIVSGTGGDDLIDFDYVGDPDGDRIDHNDAILPHVTTQDDIVHAGDGDDTVEAGEGNDLVYGGAGDDVLNGNEGNDTLLGGTGSDTVEGGDGDDVIDTGNGAPLIDYETFEGVPFDPTPNDDRDLVMAGAGNDTVTTGDDADTIYGGAGDDVIDSGIDDDVVFGGSGDDYIEAGLGSDYVEGGDGNDTILAGIDAFSDYVGDDPNLPFPGVNNPDGTPALSDPNTEDGQDTVYGGAGNDVIFTGDDRDVIFGGTGDDTIHAGIDDDYVEGGEGNDSITGGHGSDTIYGNEGDDYINAGDSSLLWGQFPDAIDPVPENGRDFVDGGEGNDTIFGEDDDDTLMGGVGDDYIDGGIDEDVITGGDGNDTIIGGQGADTLSGGDDRDMFLGSDVGDEIDGNEGGDDYDTLDLRGSAPVGGRLNVIYDPANAENGTVEYYDATNTLTGTSTFVNIENVIPCFTPGTAIATPKGERLVEELSVGDRIITRDNGIQEIRWIGAKALSGRDLMAAPHLRPILIQKGSLGNGLPERDMLVSPNHRILVNNDKAAYYFDESEVLAAAKHMTGLAGVDAVETMGTTYIHFMFDQHEVVLSNGAWTESFQPGELTLKGIASEQRDEILELFPELASVEGIDAYQAARRSLKKHEAQLLAR